jgi:flavin reductase (DIM6/NTAB) family NADH-FMN oxidoreductase RutF
MPGRPREAPALTPAGLVFIIDKVGAIVYEDVTGDRPDVKRGGRLTRERARAMAKKTMAPTDYFADVMKVLTSRGLLVGSFDAHGKANLMTIGWGVLGEVWGKPLWVVLVRPSRYTYKCIESTGCFTVNVPSARMDEACNVCGTQSGRTIDKFAVCRLTAELAGTVRAPAVAECPIVYECKVVHSGDVLSERLAPEIVDGAYAGGDFHRVYWGEILAARAEPDAARLLGP